MIYLIVITDLIKQFYQMASTSSSASLLALPHALPCCCRFDTNDHRLPYVASQLGHVNCLVKYINVRKTKDNPKGIKIIKINDLNGDGCSCLHFAAASGKLECVKFLLSAGADVNSLTAENPKAYDYCYVTNSTPLHFAVINGHIECVKELIRHGGNPNIRNSKGRTPLYLAVKYGNLECIKILLESSADPEVTTKSGETVFELSQKIGNKGVIDLLHVSCSA